MRFWPLLLLLVPALCAAETLPTGDARFHLGMNRAQIEHSIAKRGLQVVSQGANFLATTSDDPTIELERYELYPMPHEMYALWRVTFLYRIPSTREDFVAVEGMLRRQLGEPIDDTAPPRDEGRMDEACRVSWTDGKTLVLLGARWPEKAEQNESDRMLVSWVDRKLQRLVDARRKNQKSK